MTKTYAMPITKHELADAASRGGLLQTQEVLGLVGEIWRLRAKVRGMKRDADSWRAFVEGLLAGFAQTGVAPEFGPAGEVQRARDRLLAAHEERDAAIAAREKTSALVKEFLAGWSRLGEREPCPSCPACDEHLFNGIHRVNCPLEATLVALRGVE